MKKSLILLPLLAMTLVACGGGDDTSSSSTDTSSSSSEPAWSGKTNADFSKAKTTYTKDGVEKQLNRNSLYQNSGNPHLDPMSQESHVMIVPFGFEDSSYTSKQTEATRAKIQKTFLAESDEIKSAGGWESLKSFYNKSSYGKTKFDGKVLPWCIYPGTANAYKSASAGSGGVYAVSYIKSWYETEYAKENHGQLGADAEPLSYFDADNDGFLDLVWVVYSHETVDTNYWWAYVTYTGNGKGTLSSPNPKTLGWASIDWMNAGFAGYDSHTFIHETGHTLGLDDYYDYNGKWAPMGGVDFMDHNLGDHSMYSKFSLGWTAPLVVDDTARITLHPGTTTGDCFILPSPNYNGTAFDEYMMVELMAPVGLAEQDYKNGYENTTGYSQPGLRITHVDARVYKASHDVPLTTNPEEGYDVRVDNSYTGRGSSDQIRNKDTDYFPLEGGEKGFYAHSSLMESAINADNNWTTVSTYNATNSSLFKKNARFNLKPSTNGQKGWAELFMPSRSNLWNKAKTITGWTDAKTQTYEIDEECTFNYNLKVISIEPNDQYGYEAVVEVTANAY